VSLPSNTDYIQAVQQPKVAFQRADLQMRCASRNRMNMPISWSGNFAIVFRLDGPPKPLALRCFTQPVTQTQERYRAYSNFLRGQVPANLRRSLLSLEFLDAGMRVGAQSVPVILMEWQEGEDLLEWIKSHASQPRRLQALRDAFRSLLADMERCGFVHGDLQHGNVMVSSQGHPVLVDYDNLLVPGAKAFGPSNQGLPGFQHPAVNAKTDHRLLDRMPALVIYSALEILSDAPELAPGWDQIDGLVFQAKDLAHPRGSQLFQAMEAHPRFQGFGLHLVKALESTVERVPTLEAFLKEVGAHRFKPLRKQARTAQTAFSSPLPAPTNSSKVPVGNSSIPTWTVPAKQQRKLASPKPVHGSSPRRRSRIGLFLIGAAVVMGALLAGQMGLALIEDFRRPTGPRATASKKAPAVIRLEDLGPSKRFPSVSGELHLHPFQVLPVPGDSDDQPAGESVQHMVPYPIGSVPGGEEPEASDQQ
jgi:hypothetical protein